MGRSRTGLSAIAGGFCLLAFAILPAEAGEAAPANQLVVCRPTGADVAAVSVHDLRVGTAGAYFWAAARVRLEMRNGANREYVLKGRADPISKQLTPNRASPGFAYPGFACTVQHQAIAAVRNCRGSDKRRFCDVGVQIFGVPMAYSVSLTAERLVRNAAAP